MQALRSTAITPHSPHSTWCNYISFILQKKEIEALTQTKHTAGALTHCCLWQARDPNRSSPSCSPHAPCNPAYTALLLFPNPKQWLLGQIIKGDICLTDRQNRKTWWVRSFCLRTTVLLMYFLISRRNCQPAGNLHISIWNYIIWFTIC